MYYRPVVFHFFVTENEENKKRTPIEWGQLAGLADFYADPYDTNTLQTNPVVGTWVNRKLTCNMYIERYPVKDPTSYCIEFVFPERIVQGFGMSPWYVPEKIPFEEDPRMPIAEAFVKAAESLGAELAFYCGYGLGMASDEIQMALQSEYYRSIKDKKLQVFLEQKEWRMLYVSGEWLEQMKGLEEKQKRSLETTKGRLYFNHEDKQRF